MSDFKEPEETGVSKQEALARASRLTLLRIQQDTGSASQRLRPLLRSIEEHLFDPALNVAKLKAICGIRDNSIAIQFHREVGLAPKSYITERRLETAARLLINTDLLVWQIAELVAYSGLGVFSKAFNRWAGQRPNAYRRQMCGLAEETPAELFSPEFLRRAVVGKLTTGEAQWLVKRLGQIYPEARVHAVGEETKATP